MDTENLGTLIKSLFSGAYNMDDRLSRDNLPGSDFDTENIKVLSKVKGADIRIPSMSKSDCVYSLYIQHNRNFLVSLTRITVKHELGCSIESFAVFHDNLTVYQSDTIRYSSGRLDTLVNTIRQNLSENLVTV